MPSALDRWYALLDARARQMDAAYARLGRTSADYWDRRARYVRRPTQERALHEPFFQRLREVVTPESRVLDVGAGSGRYTLALASLAQHVTAVEPNAALLTSLRQDVAAQGLTNITVLPTTWEQTPADLNADLVICSHVLYPIREVVPFLQKLRAATRGACYIAMHTAHFDETISPLWQHFHGAQRIFQPSYIHALDVMYEMGIYAHVEVVKIKSILHYPTLDAAVEQLMEHLILPETQETRSELRSLLQECLVEEDGELVPPTREMVSAIIHFEADRFS